MGRRKRLCNTFKTLYKSSGFIIALYGTLLYLIDILFGAKTNYYIEFVRKYFRKITSDKIDYYLETEENILSKHKHFFNRTPVWVCWFQGLDNMPYIVDLCYKQLNRMVDENKVEIVLITLDNYSDYIDIPKVIVEKLKNNDISYTNFSDVLRVNLLAVYGGMWIDSTVFVTKRIDDDILCRDFFSQKTIDPKYTNSYVSRNRWASWLFVVQPFSKEFIFTMNLMNWYFSEFLPLDYYLIDYVLDVAYDYILSFKNKIKNLEVNNTRAFELYNIFDLDIDKNRVDSIIKETQFCKLTYKKDSTTINVNGNKTNFDYFIKQYVRM